MPVSAVNEIITFDTLSTLFQSRSTLTCPAKLIEVCSNTEWHFNERRNEEMWKAVTKPNDEGFNWPRH